MKLDSYTINELIELLQPLMEDERSRRSILIRALGNDAPVLQRITWSGAVATFITEMVCMLANHGEVEPGKQALWALLEYVRSQRGLDVQQRIDNLRPRIALGVKSMDDMLAIDINFISFIRLCLDTAEKRQNAGKLSEEQQTTINILKDKVQPLITMSDQLSEMANKAQVFLRETRQILETEIEELRSQGSNNILQIEQLKTDKAELEQKIRPLEEQLQVLRQFEQDLKTGKDAAKWLDKNRAALAKRAGNVALDEYKDLKIAFSSEQIDDFYWEIEKYLERISWCLTWGKYDLIEEPDLQTLPAYAYQMSFIYIRDQRIPDSMYSQAVTELKACISYLIERLS
ncbi:MAG: hypothetical protein RIE73_34810 [Coleofasciculus sp. C1-SOL-03]|uniref:hypothetical protein n=1 Tax=Coleofasciculus sp. C1-SOL-03 TaxID=3069522 RepID=UPI0032F10E88